MPTDTLDPVDTTRDSPAKDKAAASKSNSATATAKPTRPATLPPYHVVLLDDNDHSHEYVMEMLKAIFGYAEPTGFALADRVDRQGRAVVFTTHREFAELKRDQITAYGNDWRVASCHGSMSAIITKADGG